MKITMINLVKFRDIYPSIKSQVMPIKTSYTLLKIKEIYEKESDFYFAEVKKIVDDCAKFDENGTIIPTADGQGFLLKEDKVEEFNSRMTDLESIEVEIPSLELSLIENLEITLEQLEILNKFIG